MSADTAILAALATPLIGGLLILLTGSIPNLREAVTLVTAAVLFLIVASITPTVLAGDRPEVTLLQMLPGLDITFRVEPLGMLFGLIASGLWIINSIYSIGYMRGNDEGHQTRFYFFFAVALSSAVGVAFSGNMLTLFVCYEVLTLSTYPLVTHHGDANSLRSGRIYMGILLGTSIGLLLFGMVWTWHVAGTLNFTQGGILEGKADETITVALLFLYMFGIGKAALMPIHRWLPAAMVAPTPVSALLHAVAVVKAGAFTVVKVIVYIFGVDFLADTGATEWLMIVAAATLLIASVVAMRKDNLKARLAYSTISQLSYIVLGAALVTGTAIIGAGMHLAMHAMGKITLFFCAGAIYTAAHKTEISQLNGIGRTMPITMGAFAIASLSIIGIPPLGGSWSKFQLMLGAAEGDHLVYVFVYAASSLLSAAYLVPIIARAFLLPPEAKSAGAAAAHEGGIQEAPLPCLIALCTTAVGAIALFFYADAIAALLAPITGPITG